MIPPLQRQRHLELEPFVCVAGVYARERPGLSARQIQELARVHGALGKLPALEGALVSNDLSWSKVRELARVARPETEGAWIAEARRLSVRALAGRVCEYRARERVREGLAPLPPRSRAAEREAWLREAARMEAEERREAATHRIAVRCTPAVRERWEMARELAERWAGARLPKADALEFVLAEALSAVPIDPAFVPRPEGAEAESDEGREAGENEGGWPRSGWRWRPRRESRERRGKVPRSRLRGPRLAFPRIWWVSPSGSKRSMPSSSACGRGDRRWSATGRGTCSCPRNENPYTSPRLQTTATPHSTPAAWRERWVRASSTGLAPSPRR